MTWSAPSIGVALNGWSRVALFWDFAAMKAEDIFLAALDKQTPVERKGYLDGACGNDAALRAEVEALLHSHQEAGSFLDAPVFEPASALDSERTSRLVGPYKLLERIGEGGMGLVYMAEQQHPVRRRVALKIVKPGMDSKQVIARFETERQALAMMDHANIAKVLDAGTTDSGSPYFVMELVKGVPITKFCDEMQFTIRQRLNLFVSVCQALQHAHQKGIIHRDIKPTNVLVAVYDEVAVPKVIDFGVAKATAQKLTEKTMFTGFGQLIGTLEYMSPEQAQFNQPDIDTRSDIYSLGVLLYELLTGSTPIEQARRATVAFDETLRLIREEEPPKPSTRLSTVSALPTIAANRGVAPAHLRRQITGDLDWIVMKCLEKDRNRRYETASNLASDIQHYLHHEPVKARPPSALYRLKKLLWRNRGSVAVAGGVLLAVLMTAASIGWALRDRAARASQIARSEADRLANAERQVRDSLGLARAFVAENKLASAREKLAQAKAQLGSGGSVLANLVAEVEADETELDRFQQFLRLIDQAHQSETAPLEPSLEAGSRRSAESTTGGSRLGRRPGAAAPFLLQALQCYSVLEREDWQSNLQGRFPAAQQIEQIRSASYEVLLWLADDIVRRRKEHRSEQAISGEAAARQGLEYLSKAATVHQPTQALFVLRSRCQKALREDAASQADTQLAAQTLPTIAFDHFLRGKAAYDAKRLTDGVEAFEAALRLEPTHYWSLMNLGYCLCDLGRGPDDLAGAARVFTGCILKRPDHAQAYSCRANAYSRLRRYEEALADSSKAIELDPKFVLAWYNRGVTYDQLKQPDKALADFSKTLELDPKFAPAWNNRGVAYDNLGQPDKAVANYSQAIELDPNDVLAWHNRGCTYQNALNRPDKAVADFSKIIELDPMHVRAWTSRAAAYEDLGLPDKALADYSKAIELDPKYARVWCNRGVAHSRLGHVKMALADYSKAIDLDPKYARAWSNRSATYSRLGQAEKALADASRAIELAPNGTQLAQALMLRGKANFMLAHFEQARTDFQTALKHAPAHAAACNDLAWMLATCPDANRRDPDQAVELAKKAVQLKPQEAIFWNTLGVAHYRAGDWTAAIATVDKALELRDGGGATEQLFLAMSHWKLGHRDQALAAYEEALQWLQRNKEKLEADATNAEQLRGFQREAAEVLGQSLCK